MLYLDCLVMIADNDGLLMAYRNSALSAYYKFGRKLGSLADVSSLMALKLYHQIVSSLEVQGSANLFVLKSKLAKVQCTKQ